MRGDGVILGPMTKCGRIAIAGRPNVGKSSLLNALVGDRLAMVSPKAQATREPVVGLRTDGEFQFIFEDLPGLLDPSYLLQERMVGLAVAAIHRADVILHLHPAIEYPAPDLGTLLPPGVKPRQPVVVAYTKSDLAKPAQMVANQLYLSTEPVRGLEALTAVLSRHLPESAWQYPGDDLGTQPVRFFVTEYLREAAFQYLEDELPYSFAAEVEEFRETSDPIYIRTTLFVERESQKRILIGAGGRTIKAIGQHARLRLEPLLGGRVFLETWVKVVPHWRQSGEFLARLGFPGHS